MKLFLISFFFLSSLGAWAQVGQIKVLKGAAFINESPASNGQVVNSGDKIKTMGSSYVKLEMVDSTIIQLASSTSITLAKYSKANLPRRNDVSLLYGKLRVLVKKVANDNEQINYKAKQISLGVRGTEFMLNAYESGGAQTVDTLLLKGELKVSGASFENFILDKSQYFNSQALERKGLSAVKKLEGNLVKKLLEGREEFLPELRLENGHLDLSKFFSQKMLGIIPSGVFVKGVGGAAKVAGTSLAESALGLIGGGSRSESEVTKKARKPKGKSVKKKKRSKRKVTKASKKTRVKGVTSFRYKLRNEKWDIRDAVLNRKSNIKNNLCFYFIYKKIPGSGEAERFRRERRCNEFEYDL
jgi:hypothetical protein